MSARLILRAPLAGWCLPLAAVPDPVFAQGMAGDGLAIDPTGDTVHAPCDGEVLPGAAHALRIRADGDIEVLLHVGIDTVALKGEGFTALVAPGARVKAGDALLRIDLDLLARRAPSVVTPVLLAAGGRIVRRAAEGAIAVGEVLFEVEPVATAAGAAPATGTSRRFRVPFDHGLHLRPAALVAEALRACTGAVTIRARGRSADARSTSAMMALGVQRDEEIEVFAEGEGATRALDAIGALFGASKPEPATIVAPPTHDDDPQRLRGVVASRGFALGVAAPLARRAVAVAEHGATPAAESAALARALDAVRTRLRTLADGRVGAQQAVLVAHLALVDDPGLLAHAGREIAAGRSAAYGWRMAMHATADALRALGDARMDERVADLDDVDDQVQRELLGLGDEERELPERAIVLADELLPSRLVALDRSRIAGICTARGGPSAHAAIIAASLGIPMLVAAGARVLALRAGAALVLDAETGVLLTEPTPDQRAAAERRVRDEAATRARDLAHAREPARTADGVAIAIHANLGAVGEAAPAVALGADGCGLLRTEFLYLDRQVAPSEDEQARAYLQVATALGGRPLVIRTMDIGGDKPLPFLPFPLEENPALGLRGVRASFAHPALLDAQLRAILAVTPPGQCRILLPMVTEVAELRDVRAALERNRAALGIATAPALGVMIETPASALLADQLLAEADFASIGTNDLAQYTLAMDRAQPTLAPRLDALHPAVLRLIASVVAAGARHQRHVGLCGGLGSDPQALPILVGLGLRELSVVPAMVPQLKRVARALDTRACAALAQEALALDSASAVRTRVAQWLQQNAAGQEVA